MGFSKRVKSLKSNDKTTSASQNTNENRLVKCNSGSTKSWNSVASSLDGTILAAIATNDGIWISNNSGNDWSKVYISENENLTSDNLPIWVSITLNDKGTKFAAVQYNGYIWKSSNGITWEKSSKFTKDWLKITSNSEGNILAAISETEVWVSTDYGQNWSKSKSLEERRVYSISSIASNSEGNILLISVTRGNLWISKDTGSTWKEITSTGDIKQWSSVTSNSKGDILAATDLGGNIWISKNYGETWKEHLDNHVKKNNYWSSIVSNRKGDKLAACGANIIMIDQFLTNWVIQIYYLVIIVLNIYP